MLSYYKRITMYPSYNYLGGFYYFDITSKCCVHNFFGMYAMISKVDSRSGTLSISILLIFYVEV